ncbi:unnamed protein product [Tetraodon nigroviridis]|uniref:Integrator complex subunit 7 n=1 Tax=Tetraodon nigroviridis TaxID=99883 RepID=Q4SCV2_TETNG|nr:unnamed protein product [Tetraodon nigroviridis]
MSNSTARSFLSEACYGEQELDANSALMELDKGLRSGKLGEQCEAVVLFPKLFQKYPFPILINSAFLKLADIFRLGNNFLRLCVLKVTQQSEKHLEKILNVDEFVKRVFSVIHSNDPVARAITLRMLGSLASIIPERKNAHHSIRQSLDSHDNMEVEAAIFAAASFSAQSKDFAAGICNKVSEMIQGSTSVPPRLTDLVKLAQECCYHSNLAVAAHGVIVLSNIVISCPEKDVLQLEQETVLGVESLLMLCSQDSSPSAQAALKTGLTSLVKLLKSRPHLSQSAVEFLLGQLHLSCDSSRVLMCHSLAAIATHLPVLGDGMLGDLVDLYRVASHSSTDKQQELLVSLATVIFVASQSSLSAEVQSVIKEQLENVANGWTVYRIARQASRMGCHEFSSELYQSLRTRVASEHFYFWLNSLREFSQAEQCLSLVTDGDYSGAMSAIAEALRSYQKGIASLTAASTPLSPLTFQCEFIKLRIDTLQALSQLICTCNSLKTSPPPAIATTIALSSGNDLQRCGRIAMQMKVSMDEFRSLAARYADLHQASFDADYATLRNVELQQQSCLLVSHVIEALILDSQTASFQEYGPLGSVQTHSEYERRMMSVFSRVLEEVEGLAKKHPPVSFLHTGCLCDAVIALLKVPLSFQRYFFQKLQSTSIKIALDSKTNEIEQRVEPHNDYFSTQFLLNFSILGTHTVTVEASVVDESGIEWKTGPKTTVSVKSLEDPYSQQLRHQLQQGGAQPAPQRGAYTRF